ALLDEPPTSFAGIVAYAALLEGLLTAVAEPNVISNNLISGNDQSAIELFSVRTLNNFISFNTIGLSANGLAAIPNGTGGGTPDAIDINAGAYGNFVGPGNVVSGNTNNGISIRGAVLLPNFIAGNIVGPGA